MLTGCSAGGWASCILVTGFGQCLMCHLNACMMEFIFSDNNKIIRFHGGIEEDTIQLLTNVSGLFFTVTDWWDWDFITTEGAKIL